MTISESSVIGSQSIEGPNTDAGVHSTAINGSEFFPDKLHRLLVDAESCPADSDAIRFLPNGRAFVIRDVGRLESSILHQYFRLSSFASFRRQLNLYGIIRIRSGPDRGAYHHPKFLRQRPRGGFGIRRGRGRGQPSGGNSGSGERPRRNLDTEYYASISSSIGMTSYMTSSSSIPDTTDVVHNGNPVPQEESGQLDETSHATSILGSRPTNAPMDCSVEAFLRYAVNATQQALDGAALASVVQAALLAPTPPPWLFGVPGWTPTRAGAPAISHAEFAVAPQFRDVPQLASAGTGAAAVLIAVEIAAARQRQENGRAAMAAAGLLSNVAVLRQRQEQDRQTAAAAAEARRYKDLQSVLLQLLRGNGT